MFIGRKNELQFLEDAYASNKSCLAVIYGRRRIGKSALVKQFSLDKPYFLSFEAVENEDTEGQIQHFTSTLKQQVTDSSLANIRFKQWHDVFTYLTDKVIGKEGFNRSSEKKPVLFLDEFQWMAAGRNRLVSLVKYFWDNHWKDENLMLILCGSVASFMVKKVLSSQALYGRTNLEIHLRGLLPYEAAQLFMNKRSPEEVLKYQLLFGGVPKYLEEISLNRSFNWNVNRLCFRKNSLMLKEINRIFYSQFREIKTYLRIVKLLENGIYSLDEISKKLGIPSGGGLKDYLTNLELAEIIRTYIPYDKSMRTKLRKYTLSDEFLIFYFKFMEPNLRTIEESSSQRLFEAFSRENFNVWLGFAFERFCVKHAAYLSRLMGFEDDVLAASPHFERGSRRFQVDLVYKRMDNVITLCEIKHHNKEISPAVIPGMEQRIEFLEVPRGFTVEKALISLYGPDKALRESGYFDHHVVLDQLLGSGTPPR